MHLLPFLIFSCFLFFADALRCMCVGFRLRDVGCRAVVATVGHRVLVERPLSQRACLGFPVLRGRGPLARPRPQSESIAEHVCGHAGSLSPPGSPPCPRLELLPWRWGGSVAGDRRLREVSCRAVGASLAASVGGHPMSRHAVRHVRSRGVAGRSRGAATVGMSFGLSVVRRQCGRPLDSNIARARAAPAAMGRRSRRMRAFSDTSRDC